MVFPILKKKFLREDIFVILHFLETGQESDIAFNYIGYFCVLLVFRFHIYSKNL